MLNSSLISALDLENRLLSFAFIFDLGVTLIA